MKTPHDEDTPTMNPSPTLDDIALELVRFHQCHTVVLYGSRARGDEGPGSDVDLLGVRSVGGCTRDARLWSGISLDSFIHDDASLMGELEPGMLRIRHGKILRDLHGFGVQLLARVQALYARGPLPMPPDERTSQLAWVEKMLERIQPSPSDDANTVLMAQYRRATLLTQLLELYFQLRGHWYCGPKESFVWLQIHDPQVWQAFRDAFIPTASHEVIERVARSVTVGQT